jgi:hypothetical protein
MINISGLAENPCLNCKNKNEDDYGLLCDWVCHKHSYYNSYMKGVEDALNSKEIKERILYYKLMTPIIDEFWYKTMKEMCKE